MKSQNNQNNETDSLLRLGILGIAAFGIGYVLKKGIEATRENPETGNETDSENPEPETIRKYSVEIDDDIVMNVRPSTEKEKGNWLAILCRADGQDSDQCFYGDSKNEAIEKAFQEALSCYGDAIDN